MENIGQFLKKFYQEEEKSLLANYPGINLEILKKQFFNYAGTGYSDRKEFFQAPVWWPEEHKNAFFFHQVKQGIPFQYINGETFFFNYLFKVDRGVFIPRPETELLVEMALEELKKMGERPKVLDIGCGSGAIIISLAKCLAELHALELSLTAFEIAQINFFKLGFNFPMKQFINFKNLNFFQSDEEKYNLIVSNPPYIKRNEDGVHDRVKEFEPELALFLKDEEYEDWFNHFIRRVHSKLLPQGIFLMEGHENHLKRLEKIAQTVGFLDIIILKDLSGRDRFLKARKYG